MFLAGSLLLAVSGFGALGFVLCAGMALSAALVLRVNDPQAAPAPRRQPLPAPVPD